MRYKYIQIVTAPNKKYFGKYWRKIKFSLEGLHYLQTSLFSVKQHAP